MATTTTIIMTTPTDDASRHLALALEDLAAGRPSTAADRTLRLARQALAARIEAHNEAQRIQNEIRKLATATRRQDRREAEARARYWAARR